MKKPISKRDIDLAEKYLPIGLAAVHAALCASPKKGVTQAENKPLERILLPEHLPER